MAVSLISLYFAMRILEPEKLSHPSMIQLQIKAITETMNVVGSGEYKVNPGIFSGIITTGMLIMIGIGLFVQILLLIRPIDFGLDSK